MMFFFWGVFRGKRNSCLNQVLGSPKKIANSRDMPTASMSSIEATSPLVSIEKELPTCNRTLKLASDDNSLINLQRLPAAKTKKGDGDCKAVSDSQQNDCVMSPKEQGSGLDCKSVPTYQMKPPLTRQDNRSRSASLVISVQLILAAQNLLLACSLLSAFCSILGVGTLF